MKAKKLFGEILGILVLLWVVRYLVLFAVNLRMMDHMGDCHEELGLGSSLQAARGASREALLRKYEQCTLDKGNFVDNFFVEDSIHEIMEAMKDPHFASKASSDDS